MQGEYQTFRFGGCDWTVYPGEHLPTREQLLRAVNVKGARWVKSFLEDREERIRLRVESPYYHGLDAPDMEAWKDADECLKVADDLLIQGGNRAAKTEYAVKRLMRCLCENAGMKAWSLHTTNMSSTQMIQPLCWKYMPNEWKHLRKTKVTNISYTQKNGFAENTFVLPNGSQCWFLNYQQERNVIEGGEIDFAHVDELCPLDWVETLRYRLVTRRGKMLITFTPIEGYSPLVKSFLSGMKILKTRPADPDLLDTSKILVAGCPPGHMPYVAQCLNPKARVMWFHSDQNPFNPFDSLKDKLYGRSETDIKIRAYGYAENMSGSQFPRFGSVHIMDPVDVPGHGADYMVMDPGSGKKHHYMLWCRVDAMGRKWIFREWPDWHVGDWAIPGENPDGDYGPGSMQGAGQSVGETVELISRSEAGAQMMDRYIDPRSGNLKMTQRDGGKTLIELFMDEGIWFTPSNGIKIHEGVAIINDWLAYDPQKEVGPGNMPNLYISSNCRNLIYAMREWTGAGGEKGATKDPIDALRYLAVMDPVYIDRSMLAMRGGGSY